MTKTSPKGTKNPREKPCKIFKAIQKLLMKIENSQDFQKTEKSKSSIGLADDDRNLMDLAGKLMKNHPEISIDEALRIEKMRQESRRRREKEPKVDVTINMRIYEEFEKFMGTHNIDGEDSEGSEIPENINTPDGDQDWDNIFKVQDDVEYSVDMDSKINDVTIGIHGLDMEHLS